MITILEAALRGTTLAAIVWAAIFFLRIRNPSIERSLWLVVLCAAIAMPSLMNLPAWTSMTLPDSIRVPETILGTLTVTNERIDWQSWAFAAYAAIAGLLLLRQILGVFRLSRLLASSTPVNGEQDVRISTRVSSPATVFSTILVPTDYASWTAQERAAVLAHERTHVANGDFYVQWLAQVHRSLFWFNPLAWWLPKRLSVLSEHISDDAAAQVLNEDTRYAEMLVAFARRTVENDLAIAMARPSTLSQRVERMLDPHRSRSRTRGSKRIAVALAVIPIVGLVAGFQTQAESMPNASRDKQFGPRAGVLAPLPNVVLPRSNPAMPLSPPQYPATARKLKQTGTVVLRLLVLEDGSVGDATIEKSTGYPDLDYSAMYEAYRWRLTPGTVNGIPDRMWGQFAVTFKLSK